MASVRNGGRVRRRRIFACSVAVYFTAISTLITRTRQSVLSCAVVSSPVKETIIMHQDFVSTFFNGGNSVPHSGSPTGSQRHFCILPGDKCHIQINITLIVILAILLIKFPLSEVFEGLMLAPEKASRVNPFKISDVDGFNFSYFAVLFFIQFYGCRFYRNIRRGDCR